MARYQTNLAGSHRFLGEVYSDTKQYQKAEAEYIRSLDVATELLKKFPDSKDNWLNTQWPRGKLVRVYVWTRQYDKAKSMSDAAIADCEARLNAKPESKTYQRGLAVQLLPRTALLAALGKQEDAIATAKRLASLEYDPKVAAVWAAMGLSLAVRAVTENEKLDEATRQQRVETYAKEAIGMLELAIDRGFVNAAVLRTDNAFDPIRDRKDFQAIVERVAGEK